MCVTKVKDNLHLKMLYRFFVAVHYNIETVIKKGGGNRPFETLATLYF